MFRCHGLQPLDLSFLRHNFFGRLVQNRAHWISKVNRCVRDTGDAYPA
jgi:hypothetical protein